MNRDERFYAFIVSTTTRSRSYVRRFSVHKRWVKASALVAAFLFCAAAYGVYGLTREAVHLRIEEENNRLRLENERQRRQLNNLKNRVDAIEDASRRLSEMSGVPAEEQQQQQEGTSPHGAGGPALDAESVELLELRAARGGDVLAGVELGAAPAERVAADAEAVGGLALDGPDGGDACALPERRLVEPQLGFEPRGARLKPLDRRRVEFERGAARAVHARALLLLLPGLDARHLGEAARVRLDGVDAVFELPELLALLLVLKAEAVVLLLYAQVYGLAREPVDAVSGGAEQERGDECRSLDPALVDGEASDVGT